MYINNIFYTIPPPPYLNSTNVDSVKRLTNISFLIHFVLRNQEQGDTFRPLRGTGQSCQHAVNDVIGHIVFATTDEDLGSVDLEPPVSERFCLGGHLPTKIQHACTMHHRSKDASGVKSMSAFSFMAQIGW